MFQAELFLLEGQNRVEQSTFETVKHVENRRRLRGIALESPLAPRGRSVVLGTSDDWLRAFDADSPAIRDAAGRLRQNGTFIGDADDVLAARAALIEKVDGFDDVIIHAHTNIGPGEPLPTFFINTSNGSIAVPVEHLAAEIQKLGLAQGRGIRLISCGGGSCGMQGVNLAGDLARLLNRRVLASDAPINLRENGILELLDPIQGWRIIEP